jgi:hypothetical protein
MPQANKTEGFLPRPQCASCYRQVTSSQLALDTLPSLFKALAEAGKGFALQDYNPLTHSMAVEEGQAVLRLPAMVSTWMTRVGLNVLKWDTCSTQSKRVFL